MIEEGIQEARQLTKQYAKSYYFSSHFLPKEQQNASFTLYAICRITDETVDQPGLKEERLNSLKRKIDLAYSNCKITDDNLLEAFSHTVNAYNIPKAYFDELIKGMEQDMSKSRYRNFSELYDYCYKVAGVVGLMMNKILGAPMDAQNSAISLGVAMQLTNILRDIREDLSRGRIYLPLDELNQYRLTEESIASGEISKDFKAFMKFQIARARTFYADTEMGIKMIPNKRGRFMVRAMKEIYSGILDSIEKMDYDVFSNRAYVSGLRKIALAARLMAGKV
jgi:phytoene synthase